MAVEPGDKKKVTISLSKVEWDKLQLITEKQGFSRATDFFRHILHKTHSDILAKENSSRNTYDN